MNFIETIFSHLKAKPNAAFVSEVHGERIVPTHGAALLSLIHGARTALRTRGVKAGDRVALIAANSARWVAADLAILAEGAICVPMYARQASNELVTMMKDCGASLVICATPELEMAINEAGNGAPAMLFDELFSAEATETEVIARKGDDAVTLVYTSGTSGDAKGAILTTANIDYMLPVTRDALRDLMGGSTGEDRVFHYLPFCFAGSRMVLWTCLYRGGGILVSTNLDNLVVEMKTAAPNYFLNVPALLERIRKGVEAKIAGQGMIARFIYKEGKAAFAKKTPTAVDDAKIAMARKLVFSRIRAQLGKDLVCLICGSAPLSEETQRWFEMIGLPVHQVYGLTETTAIVTMDRPNKTLPGRVGYVIPGCEAKLGEGDELLVRGPNIFPGYWKREEATANAFLDGWFRTGDQVELDEGGNLRVIGRVGNVLVPESGHNVAPEPIEQALLDHMPKAEHAVVVGHGRPYLTAIVTGKVAREDVAQAVEQVNASLPHYRRIRAFHLALEPLTIESGLLTANQKLRRRAIETHFKDALKELYT
ncbi:MAG: AMP-binding protein [Sandaracinaceae bacterium]|nr:AMP-binding protein [Sandaracinaceae bacterium]